MINHTVNIFMKETIISPLGLFVMSLETVKRFSINFLIQKLKPVCLYTLNKHIRRLGYQKLNHRELLTDCVLQVCILNRTF